MANVINYLWPVLGSTPPTAAQSSVVNSVRATITPTQTNSPTQAITHNLGISAADISSGFEDVGIEPLDSLAGTSGWYVQSIDPNFIGLAQGNSSGGYDTNVQVKVTISRPHTIVR